MNKRVRFFLCGNCSKAGRESLEPREYGCGRRNEEQESIMRGEYNVHV